MTKRALSEHPGARTALIRDRLTNGQLSLPVLPNVAAEVLASSVDDRSDAARLAMLIQHDQSLASYVLRITNSPAFRSQQEIVSLQQAIARLGMQRIREVALSASVRGALFRGGIYQARADALWRLSLSAGLWSREIARVCRRSVEIAYLCGLLHRIGAPLILQRLNDLPDALDDTETDMLLEELAPVAGVQLARGWNLPAPIAATIAHFHAPESAGAHADLVAVANLGVAFAAACQHPETGRDALTPLPAASRLNLYPEDIDALLTHRHAIEQALASMVL